MAPTASGTARIAALAVGFAAGIFATTSIGTGPSVVVLGAGEVAQTDAPHTPVSGAPTASDPADDDGVPTSPTAPGEHTDAGTGVAPGTSTDSRPPSGGSSGPTGSGGTGGSRESGPTGTTPPSPGPPARGVTADTVEVGVAVLDIGALRNLGPGFDIGDGEEQMEAWLAGVRRDGLLPIHGRDLVLHYRTHAPTALDANSQRASCQGFVADDEVFAVIASSEYPVGAECVARENATPIVATNGVLNESYERGAPYLYTVEVGLERLTRSWVRWAHARGLLEGRTIGLYMAGAGADHAQQRVLRDAALVPALAAVGQRIAVEHQTDQPLGGPQDSVAVNKFQSQGVDLAILWTSKAGFMQNARAQGYRPTYLEYDYKAGTNDTTAERHPPEQFDGTLGMTAVRWGETNSGVAPNARANACDRYFQEHTGRTASRETAEYGAMNGMCDLGWILLEALERAGPDLRNGTFLGGIQAIRALELGGHFEVGFGPGKYDGTDQQRTLRWEGDCACWQVVSDPAPLPPG